MAAQPRDMPPMGFDPFPDAAPGDGRGPPGDDAGWPPFPSMDAFLAGAGHTGNSSPRLPCASPLDNLACPLGNGEDPFLTTPAVGSAKVGHNGDNPVAALAAGSKGFIGELGNIDKWAWEVGSEAGSMPSTWSKATSRTGTQSTVKSMSTALGDGLIPGLVDGQRLSTVKPSYVPTAGGKVIVTLRKEVPQGYWDTLSIVLVNLPVQITLKPTGIKKGKKLCVEVPSGMKEGDYDVRLKFGDKIIHGSIPLSVQDGNEEDMDEEDDDLKALTEGVHLSKLNQ
mmetsp:Transcript_51107/g.150703  ORF Transcript_51107/g.150703 Transcript_51107/m.150703 type:complete len:282 (+) Transcript_51107:27-872(+)